MKKLIFLACMLPLLAQETPAPKPAKKPQPPPKNLQVLKVADRQELIGLMRGYNAALGVECSFCHVQGDFAADDNEHKKIARTMITMVSEVNTKFFDAKTEVTCYTCHRGGDKHPPKAAPAPADAPKPAER